MTTPALIPAANSVPGPDSGFGDGPGSPDLAALVAQRLCHDLVNPLGAIGNGLELLTMTQAPTPELVLMRDSLDQALGRIKLYRLAFGAAPQGARMPGADLAAALEGVGGSRPVQRALDLPADLSRADARLVALLALCAETALAWGGNLSIRLDSMQGLELRATAPRLRQDTDLWDSLHRGEAPANPTPPQVQFAAAPAAARAAGRRLQVALSAEAITLTG